MTCENCIHQNVCVHLANDANDTYAYMGVKYDFTNCKFFKDKSEWVRLPCKVGDTVYIATEHRCVLESKVRTMFIGRSNVEMIRTQHYDIPFSDFGKTLFLTKEEAEKALAEREK